MHRLKPRRWDGILTALVLVRLGQELGTATPLAKAVHDVLAALAGIIK